jgi:hypothetical protein
LLRPQASIADPAPYNRIRRRDHTSHRAIQTHRATGSHRGSCRLTATTAARRKPGGWLVSIVRAASRPGGCPGPESAPARSDTGNRHHFFGELPSGGPWPIDLKVARPRLPGAPKWIFLRAGRGMPLVPTRTSSRPRANRSHETEKSAGIAGEGRRKESGSSRLRDMAVNVGACPRAAFTDGLP